MPILMFSPGRGPVRRSVAAVALVSALLGASCVSPQERAGTSSPATGGSPFGLPDLGTEEMRELAFAVDDEIGSELLGPSAPSGTPYRTCIVDYRAVDWSAGPDEIVDAHASASAVACAEEEWYRQSAFQNGILGFMVLVGEETLAAAGPVSQAPADVADSLRRQGFDRLASIEITGSGQCDHGEVQAALLTLHRPSDSPAGLESMVASAEVSGATVEHSPAVTVITGGGAPCATAIVHTGAVLGWVTATDRRQLDSVLAGMVLAGMAMPGMALPGMAMPGMAMPVSPEAGARPGFG